MAGSSHQIVIEAGRSQLHYWGDLWRYPELFFFLAWRGVLVRYKQTVIGMAWSVLRPLPSALRFNVRDPMDEDGVWYGYGGPMPGAVRPVLDWNIERGLERVTTN